MRIETLMIRVTDLKPLLRLVLARHEPGLRYLLDEQSRES
jgi:hypothetical protein